MQVQPIIIVHVNSMIEGQSNNNHRNSYRGGYNGGHAPVVHQDNPVSVPINRKNVSGNSDEDRA